MLTKNLPGMPGAIWRLSTVMDRLGRSRSGVYADMKKGVLTRQVKLSSRTVGWPAHEVQALAQARIAGCGDADLQALVCRLHLDRSQAVRIVEAAHG